MCAAYAIGSISGSHINPAVTAGLWALGKTKSGDVPFYMGGQVIGGLVGAVIIFVIAHSDTGFSAKDSGFASNGYGSHSPGGFKLSAVILTEIVFTALFVFVIASTSRKSMPLGFTGVAVGLMLTVIHLITIPVDNTSVNPRAASRRPCSNTIGRSRSSGCSSCSRSSAASSAASPGKPWSRPRRSVIAER